MPENDACDFCMKKRLVTSGEGNVLPESQSWEGRSDETLAETWETEVGREGYKDTDCVHEGSNVEGVRTHCVAVVDGQLSSTKQQSEGLDWEEPSKQQSSSTSSAQFTGRVLAGEMAVSGQDPQLHNERNPAVASLSSIQIPNTSNQQNSNGPSPMPNNHPAHAAHDNSHNQPQRGRLPPVYIVQSTAYPQGITLQSIEVHHSTPAGAQLARISPGSSQGLSLGDAGGQRLQAGKHAKSRPPRPSRPPPPSPIPQEQTPPQPVPLSQALSSPSLSMLKAGLQRTGATPKMNISRPTPIPQLAHRKVYAPPDLKGVQGDTP